MKNKKLFIGCLFLLLVFLFSFLGPLVYSMDPDYVDLYKISTGPGPGHVLGTDELGRDILARLMYGGRVSLGIGLMATGLKIVIALVLGMLAGYYRGAVDNIIMRLADIIMCFPFYILAISLASIRGPSAKNLILIISVFGWPGTARIIRSEVLKISNQDYIVSARINGFSSAYIIGNHVLPNIFNSLVLVSTMSIAQAILIESSLSFLGMGVRPPRASWGNMLSSVQSMMTLQREWWIWLPAGLFVIVTVLSINLIGDGLKAKMTE